MRRHKKLSSYGFTQRVILPIIVVTAVSVIGIRTLLESHAAPIPAVVPADTSQGATRSVNPSLTSGKLSEAEALTGNPSVSLPPNPNIQESTICNAYADDNSPKCNENALDAINNARRQLEGLGPLQLNIGAFEGLDIQKQLFVVTNLERISRGLAPAQGLTNQLINDAQSAANINADPTIGVVWTLTGGVPAAEEGGNEGRFTDNALGSDYYWMYDDGPGGANGECATTPSQCWLHREIILGPYNAFCPGEKLYMGDAYASSYTDFTELLVGACGTPTDVVFTWQQALEMLNGVHDWKGPSTLYTNQTLKPDQSLASTNGQYRLTYQGDGNLVEYNTYDEPVWESGTGGKGVGYLIMQGDGNLVIYNSAKKWLWQTVTGGEGSDNRVVMQGDGNVVMYNSKNVPLWDASSGKIYTTKSTLSAGQNLDPGQSLQGGSYHLIYQTDGNLVIYNLFGQAVWESGTNGKGVGHVAMQHDGNLVIYNATGQALWQSGTGGTGDGNRLVMQSDGNLVIYNSSYTALWDYGSGILF